MHYIEENKGLRLMRFINPKMGPILSIRSSPYPSLWRRWFWHSTAQLHPEWRSSRNLKIFNSSGSGWHQEKEKSQYIALTESVERWAIGYFRRHGQKEAALDIDPTSTGFAALPNPDGSVILNAYCEALERWALGRLWDCGDIQFKEVSIKENQLKSLFSKFKGSLHCFEASLMNQLKEPSNQLTFFLCLFRTNSGGVIPGSACGPDIRVVKRAVLECYSHVRAFERMSRQECALEDIYEKRLWFFANKINGFKIIEEKIILNKKVEIQETPEITFSKNLEGPWNPDILVHRVLLKNFLPHACGGVDRFVI